MTLSQGNILKFEAKFFPVISNISSFLQSVTDGRQYSITCRHFSFPS